jgi:hypothetical protein
MVALYAFFLAGSPVVSAQPVGQGKLGTTPKGAQATATGTATFVDVPPDSPFYPYIERLAGEHVLGGYEDGTFRPNNPVSRGQVAKVLSNAAGYDETPGGQTFADVPVDDPFYPYIERIASRNIVGGYECGRPSERCDDQERPYFRPAGNMSRGQIAKVIANARGYNDQIPSDYQSFGDVPPSHTFWLYIERAAQHRVVSGYGFGSPCSSPCFRPENDVTRGQTAKIVVNAFFSDDSSDNCGSPPPLPNDWITTDRHCSPAGATFRLAAGVFEPGETVSVYMTAPGGAVYPIELSGEEQVADGDGIVGPATIHTTTDMPPGIWRVTAEGTSSHYSIWTYFKIVSPDTEPADPCQGVPASTNMTVCPSNCAPAGTTFTFTGSNFQPGENVSAYITAPDGTVIAAGFQLTADDNGNTDELTFITNANYPPGLWVTTMEGAASGQTAHGYFKLLAP